MQSSNHINSRVPEDFYHQLKEMVVKVVGRYVARGIIPKRERNDVEISIIEKFILKREKIERSFQGKAKISTYYIAILNRMCAEVIRKEQKHWYSINEQAENSFSRDTTVSFDAAKQTLIKEELMRFKALIMLFNGTSAKVLLFLKFYFDIPLQQNDIENYAGKQFHEVKKLLDDRSNMSKAEVNKKLADVVLLVEKKQVGGDAVRMWINKQLDIVLCRLNGKNKRFHTKETISLMLEMQAS